MSYTNWEMTSKLFIIQDDFNYFLNLSDEIKDKATSILPYPIRSVDEVRSSHLGTFINTLQGFINTVKIVNGDLENTTKFNITEIPDKSNFVACYINEYDIKTRHNYNMVCVTANDLINFFETNSKEVYYTISVNPNLARLFKLLVGDDVENVNYELQSRVFLSSIGYKISTLYRKNMGFNYNETKLTEQENAASAGWLTNDLLGRIVKVANALAPCVNSCSSSIYASGCVLLAMNIVKEVEQNLEKYIGYEYTNEIDFTYEHDDVDYLGKYLYSHYTDKVKQVLPQYNVYDILYDKLLDVITNQDIYTSSIESIIECLIVDILKSKGIRGINELPINYQAIVREYDITLSNLLNIMLKRTSSETPLYDKIRKNKLRGYHPNHIHDFVEYENDDKTLTVYPVTSSIVDMSVMTNVLQQKYKLLISEMKEYESLFEDYIKDKKLKLEASTIYYVLERGLANNIGGIFKSHYDYKVAMRQYGLPISELIKIIKVTKE